MRRIKKTTFFYIVLGIVLVATAGCIAYWVLRVQNSNEDDENETTTNSNSNTNNKYNDSDLYYVRSPYGVKFLINDNSNLDFVVSYSHFDSPGVSSSENSLALTETKSEIGDQGSQEVSEANKISEVLDYFKAYYETNNVLFMGDTNIKLSYQNAAFNLNTNHHFAFEDSSYYNTTLSSSNYSFANPYDKIIYQLNADDFSINNATTVNNDIESVIQPNINNGFIINTYLTLPSSVYSNGVGWINYNGSLYEKSGYDSIYRYVDNIVSDHLPIGINLSYLNNASNSLNIRIGEWNALNFNLNTGSLANISYDDLDSLTSNQLTTRKRQIHAINLANIIYNAKYDVIGLLEILKTNTITQLQDFIDYLNTLSANEQQISYQAILSDTTPAINTSSGQIEKVLIIYNEKKVKIDTNYSPSFYTNGALSTTNNTDLNIIYLTLKDIYFVKNQYI